MTILRSHVLVACFLIAGCATGIFGQVSSTIRGEIADQTGARVPGAQLVLTDVETNVQRKTVERH